MTNNIEYSMYNIKTVFKTNNTISSLLINNKDKTNKFKNQEFMR